MYPVFPLYAFPCLILILALKISLGSVKIVATVMLHHKKPRTIIPKKKIHFNIKFKLSLVEVIHKHTKCSLDVHVLIHF